MEKGIQTRIAVRRAAGAAVVLLNFTEPLSRISLRVISARREKDITTDSHAIPADITNTSIQWEPGTVHPFWRESWHQATYGFYEDMWTPRTISFGEITVVRRVRYMPQLRIKTAAKREEETTETGNFLPLGRHMKTLVTKVSAVGLAMMLSTSVLFSQVASNVGNVVSERAVESIVKIEAYDPATGKPGWFGSGFIVAPDGKILTNYHVIRNSKQGTIRLANGDAFDNVEIMDVDERKDIALLKIKAVDLRPLQLGISKNVVRGDAVFALGHPLGIDEVNMSNGIISGFYQNDGYRFFLTTAAISHGSSGGPLLNDKGEVIGITTATQPDGQNLNFVVPIDYARGIVADPQAPRPWAEVYKPDQPSFAQEAEPRDGGNTVSGYPTDLRTKTATFLISKLGTWTTDDARKLMGEPLEVLPVQDDTKTVVGVLLSYPDPSQDRSYKMIALAFGVRSKLMEGFYLYPQNGKWEELKKDLKKATGIDAKPIKNSDGSRIYLYEIGVPNETVLSVATLVDKRGNVVYIAFYL